MSVETNVTRTSEVKINQPAKKEVTTAFKWFHATSLNEDTCWY
ncbi:hypothetical protein [Metabacillus litoralis]|nr:hypothetical protein [Metabacillus litoralis]